MDVYVLEHLHVAIDFCWRIEKRQRGVSCVFHFLYIKISKYSNAYSVLKSDKIRYGSIPYNPDE